MGNEGSCRNRRQSWPLVIVLAWQIVFDHERHNLDFLCPQCLQLESQEGVINYHMTAAETAIYRISW